jgi:hypothetical protein
LTLARDLKERAAAFPGIYLAIIAALPLYVVDVFFHRPLFVTILVQGMVAGFITGMMVGIPFAMVAMPLAALFLAASVGASNSTVLAIIVVTIAALVYRLALYWGAVVAVSLPLIFVGLWIFMPPVALGKDPTSAANVLAVGLLFLGGALYAALLGGVMRVKNHLPATPGLPLRHAAISGVMTALAFAPATWIIMRHHLGQGGSWFILTVVVVFQPFSAHPWRKTLERVFGTFVGFAIAYVITLLLPTDAKGMAFILPGIALFAVAAHVISDPTKPYWLWATTFTSALILILGASSGQQGLNVAIRQLDQVRLVATLSGAATSIVMTAIVVGVAALLKRPLASSAVAATSPAAPGTTVTSSN